METKVLRRQKTTQESKNLYPVSIEGRGNEKRGLHNQLMFNNILSICQANDFLLSSTSFLFPNIYILSFYIFWLCFYIPDFFCDLLCRRQYYPPRIFGDF